MSGHYVFGYGSLVNAETHTFAPLFRARLEGWRRAWKHKVLTPTKRVTSLTIEPHLGSAVDGVVAHVPDQHWEDLNKREEGYDQISLSGAYFAHSAPAGAQVITYQSRGDVTDVSGFPILLSYLDTVMLGFHQIGGHDAAAGFVNTTTGWDTPVLDDRADPIYPRAVFPDPVQRDMIEDLLRPLDLNMTAI